jgi:hypothetical protein
MKGNPKVIDYLNKAPRHELTAVNQYWLHYRLLDNWATRRLQSNGWKAARLGFLLRVVSYEAASWFRPVPPCASRRFPSG